MRKVISLLLVSLMLLTLMSPLVVAERTELKNNDIEIVTNEQITASVGEISEENITSSEAEINEIKESEWYKERLQETEQERLMTTEQKNYHDDIFKDETYDPEDEIVTDIDVESLDADLNETQRTEDEEQVKKQFYVKTSEDFDITTIENGQITRKLDDGYIVEIPVTQINELVQNKNVQKIVDENSIKNSEMEEQNQIRNAYRERNIKREYLEVKPDEIEAAKEESILKLEELGYDIEDNVLSPYSYYFLDTSSMPATTTIQEAYDESSSIVYLSDKILWEQDEKWVSPNTVFEDTPLINTNPTTGAVSDCEEHAITFVAMARQQNIPAENVRIATGYVEINNEKFGHAWAQIKLTDGTWMNVEPTSGSYIENNELVEHNALGLYYYKDKTYPVVEIWSYFNDKYYVDSSGSAAPEDWTIQSTSYNVGNEMTPSFAGYFDEIITWAQQEMYLLLN